MAQSSGHVRCARTDRQWWHRSALVSDCPICATSNSRDVRRWGRGAFVLWWCRLGDIRTDHPGDRGSTFPELGNVRKIQRLSADPLYASLDVGRVVDHNAFGQNQRHARSTGKKKPPPTAAALLR